MKMGLRWGLLCGVLAWGCEVSREVREQDFADGGVRATDLGHDSQTPDLGVDMGVDLSPDMGVDLGFADLGEDLGSVADLGNRDSGTPDLGSPPVSFSCPGNSGPHENLRAFWSTFDREYALFAARLPQESWANLGNQACAQLSPSMSDSALFDLLLSMAQNLDDGHIQLESGALGRSEDAWVSAYPYYSEVGTLELNAESEYLEDELSWSALDWFAWGRTSDNIGYLSITSMDELSNSGDEDDDLDAAQDAMRSAMSALSDARGLVIDVRANEGGWDTVALEVATWVQGPRQLAWSKRQRSGPGHSDFGAWEEVFVQASRAGAYAGPVVVLTSGGTFSAAETFVLAMRQRPNVTIVGERTSGHFSDLYDAQLPNGWSFTYSGDQYRAADGVIYEALGAPVDQLIALDVQALASGQDTMLEAAITSIP